MKRIAPILILVIQFVLGLVLEVVLLFIPLGSFLQLVALFLASTVAVWGIGLIAAKRHLVSNSAEWGIRLVITGLGSLFGVLLLTQVGQAGFVGLFVLPMLGALLGYYFALALAANNN